MCCQFRARLLCCAVPVVHQILSPLLPFLWFSVFKCFLWCSCRNLVGSNFVALYVFVFFTSLVYIHFSPCILRSRLCTSPAFCTEWWMLIDECVSHMIACFVFNSTHFLFYFKPYDFSFFMWLSQLILGCLSLSCIWIFWQESDVSKLYCNLI